MDSLWHKPEALPTYQVIKNERDQLNGFKNNIY
jgi:hypothetical protein